MFTGAILSISKFRDSNKNFLGGLKKKKKKN